ncbi:MAG: GNAT family N-acetyltransferase [Alphaproteobacteria bacterium]|nr:GNAT family N-acetyltransferase [Alphaproteobacteria bacterium]
MAVPRLNFEPLGRHHDRRAFACGEPALDDYLKSRASQDVRRDVARVFVAVPPGTGDVAGYYTLGAFTIGLDRIPEEFARGLPPYGDLPAALIGRLARDLRWRGERVGELLLTDAIGRVLDATSRLAIHAIVVDAKNDTAAAFYRSFGFRPQVSRPNRLFLAVATAREGRR